MRADPERVTRYTGGSPATLAADAAISAKGIAEGRLLHFERKAEVDLFTAYPRLYFAAIHPCLSTDEAIEDAKAFARRFSTWPRWRQRERRRDLVETNKTILFARYFRRFGARVWSRAAA